MVIFINQIRMKIGVMYGSPETTTGGNALKFYASVRLDIRRIGAIKERDEVVGNQTRVKVVKNKLAPPFKQVEFDIMYGEGVSKMGELLDLGVKAGLVEKSGAWFSYDSQRLGQGRENSKAFLRANPDITSKIEAAIRQNAGLIAEQFSGRWRCLTGIAGEGLRSPAKKTRPQGALRRSAQLFSRGRAILGRPLPLSTALHFAGHPVPFANRTLKGLTRFLAAAGRQEPSPRTSRRPA
jgi:hypothetical protein